jgi:hypothetical protein
VQQVLVIGLSLCVRRWLLGIGLVIFEIGCALGQRDGSGVSHMVLTWSLAVAWERPGGKSLPVEHCLSSIAKTNTRAARRPLVTEVFHG